MDLEKLKPWNWFKHEENSDSLIPASRSEISVNNASTSLDKKPVSGDPFSSLLQLQQEVEHMFDSVRRSFGLPSSLGQTRISPVFGGSLLDNTALGAFHAKLDVSGGDREYEVSIELPGLSEDDVHLDIQGNVLTIQGKKEEVNEENKDKQYYRVERSVGSFLRTLSLPDDADVNKINANMKNGVLTLVIPRELSSTEGKKSIPISS